MVTHILIGFFKAIKYSLFVRPLVALSLIQEGPNFAFESPCLEISLAEKVGYSG